MPDDDNLVSNIEIGGVDKSISDLDRLANAGERAFNKLGEAAKSAGGDVGSAGDQIDKSVGDISKRLENIHASASNVGSALGGLITGFVKFGAGVTTAFTGAQAAISGFVLGVSKLTAAARGATVNSNEFFREQRKLTQQNLRAEQASIQYASSLRKLRNDLSSSRITYAQYSDAVQRLKEDFREQQRVQEETAAVQNEMVKQQEKLRTASQQRDAQLRLEIALGQEAAQSLIRLGAATERVQFAFRDAFSPAFATLFDAIGEQIERNMPAIQAFADRLGTAFSKFIDDNKDKLPALFEALMQTISALGDVIVNVIVPAFQMLQSTAGSVATIINTLFGTDITGGAVLAALAVAKVTNAFGLLLSAVRLVTSSIGLVGAVFGGWGILIAGLVIASAVAVAAIIAHWDEIKAGIGAAIDAVTATWQEFVDSASSNTNALVQGVVDAWQRLVDFFSGLWETIVQFFVDAGSLIAETMQQAAKAVEDSFKAIAAPVQAVLEGIISTAKQAVALISQAMGGGGGGEGFAGGGHIRGRGTGTSDSIPIWASNGEFMMRAAAVRKYGLGLMYAINNLSLDTKTLGGMMQGFKLGGLISSISPPMPRMALGGAVMSGGPDTHQRPIELILGEKRISGLSASSEALNELQRFSVMNRVRSTGRKPSWKGA